MGMIGSAIGGAAAIGGGIAASKLAGQNIKDLQQQMKDLKAEKTKSAVNTDANMYSSLNAADQAAITNTQQMMQEAIQNAQNNVVGSTAEQAALTKGQAIQSVGNQMQNQAVQRNQRRTDAWKQGQQEQQQWENYIMSTQQQINSARSAQAEAIQSAAKGVGDSASKLDI